MIAFFGAATWVMLFLACLFGSLDCLAGLLVAVLVAAGMAVAYHMMGGES